MVSPSPLSWNNIFRTYAQQFFMTIGDRITIIDFSFWNHYTSKKNYFNTFHLTWVPDSPLDNSVKTIFKDFCKINTFLCVMLKFIERLSIKSLMIKYIYLFIVHSGWQLNSCNTTAICTIWMVLWFYVIFWVINKVLLVS